MRRTDGASRGIGSLGAAALILAAAAAVGPRASAQAAAGTDGPALTVSVGPRGGEWKRVFNPFRDDSETRFPSTAGIYEPLIIDNRATGTYIPWLATGYEWAANNTRLRFSTFKRPYTPGLVYIGHQPIVPEHKWKSMAQPASYDDPDPVGTGPFTEVWRFAPTVYELGRNPLFVPDVEKN